MPKVFRKIGWKCFFEMIVVSESTHFVVSESFMAAELLCGVSYSRWMQELDDLPEASFFKSPPRVDELFGEAFLLSGAPISSELQVPPKVRGVRGDCGAKLMRFSRPRQSPLDSIRLIQHSIPRITNVRLIEKFCWNLRAAEWRWGRACHRQQTICLSLTRASTPPKSSNNKQFIVSRRNRRHAAATSA